MLTETQREQAVLMAKNGYTIVRICKELDVDWSEVRGHLEAVGIKGFRGAKVVITNRLNALKTEADEKKRARLAAEADRWVDYLYYEASRLSRNVDSARNALRR